MSFAEKKIAAIPEAKHRSAAASRWYSRSLMWALLMKSVKDRLLLVGIVGTVMIAMGAFVGALWPSLRNTFAELPDGFIDVIAQVFPGADLGSGVGFVNTELISVVAPVGAIAVAVISAARGTAGEEENKTLGLLLSTPMSRKMFLLNKIGAMCIHVLAIGVTLVIALIIADLLGNIGLTPKGIVGASTHTVMLGILFGMITIAIASATARRRLATALSAGLAVIALAISAFFPLLDSIAGLAVISPWYYFNTSNPLVHGIDTGHVMLLGAGSVIAALCAVGVFSRRDLRG